MKKFEYKGKQWHEECFCCMICKEPIKNKSFIPRDEQVVCVPCYEDQFAQKCTKCNGVSCLLILGWGLYGSVLYNPPTQYHNASHCLRLNPF